MSFSRKATIAEGVVTAYLLPKLARGKSVDLRPAFDGITSRNFIERRNTIIGRIRDLARGKLAQDGSIENLPQVVDGLTKFGGPDYDDATDRRRARDDEDEPSVEDMIMHLAKEFGRTGDESCLEKIRLLSKKLGRSGGNRSQEDHSDMGASDRAKHALDEANERHRRLTGRLMTFDEAEAWKRREKHRLMALDTGNRQTDRTVDELFPESKRFSDGCVTPEAFRKEMDAMFARVGA